MEIVLEGPDRLADYESVPCAFTVAARVNLDELKAGNLVADETTAYGKDYDAEATERPTQVALRSDPNTWSILVAYDGALRVGGAIVAPASNYPISGSRLGDRVLVDLRIAPNARRRGVGKLLLEAALAQDRSPLLVETQDTNVAACRLYWSMGAVPLVVEPDGYPGFSDEAKIVWRFAPA